MYDKIISVDVPAAPNQPPANKTGAHGNERWRLPGQGIVWGGVRLRQDVIPIFLKGGGIRAGVLADQLVILPWTRYFRFGKFVRLKTDPPIGLRRHAEDFVLNLSKPVKIYQFLD